MTDKQADHPEGKERPNVGIHARRGCTDCFFLIIYFIVLGGMGFLTYLAIENGNPRRLLYGTDYMGNMCGQDEPANLTLPAGSAPWSERKLLWYPITYDYKSAKLLVLESVKLGVCVKECPKSGDTVPGYGVVQPGVSASASFHAMRTSPKWPVLFSSSETFYRCVPDFLSFQCNVSTGNNITAIGEQANSCLDSLAGAAERFGNAAQISDIIDQGLAEITENWWVIAASVGICIFVSFFWMFLVRCIVKPIVVFTLFLVLAALGGGGYLCWYMRGAKLEATPPQPDAAEYFKWGAIVLWILTFLYLCLLIFAWKDIMIACDVIEEASKVPVSIPTMVALPPMLFIFVIPLVLFHLYVAIYIQSSGNTIDVELPMPNFFDYSNGTLHTNFTNASQFISMLAANQTIPTKEYAVEDWRDKAHLYNAFVFLWGFGFLNAIGYLCLALCAVFWYFSCPGDKKSPPVGSVCIALKTCFRYHIGTLAFGSLIVALIQLLRIIMMLVEQRMKELGERTEAVKFVFKVIHCCLACLERVVKFINKNAYIVCAINGENFLTAARTGLNLLTSNALSVGAVSVIGEYVMTFGKICITAATVVISWVIMDHQKTNTGITNGVLVLGIIGFISFLIASLFIAVFSVCIDTILICFCYDKDHPEFAYFPSDLAKHVAAAEARKESKEGAKKALHGQEMEKPLLATPGQARVNRTTTVNDDEL